MDTEKKIIYGGIVAIVVILAWWFFWPTRITNYPPRPGPIIAFGDSLVSGTGSNSGKDFVSILSKGIQQPIVNMGRAGDTTAQGVSRMEGVVEKHPSIVLLLFGGNDYLQKKPREETFSNLAVMIENLQDAGAVVILLGVRGGLLHDNFASEFAALARKYGTLYVPDVLDGIIGNEKMLSDEVHPNDAGYEQIAKRIYPELRKVLK